MADVRPLGKPKSFVPPMADLTRKPMETIVDALLRQGEDLIPPANDSLNTQEDVERYNILTPDLLESYVHIMEEHRPLEKLLKSYRKTIQDAMGQQVYFTREGYEVMQVEQERLLFNQDRCLREFRHVYDACRYVNIARILTVKRLVR